MISRRTSWYHFAGCIPASCRTRARGERSFSMPRGRRVFVRPDAAGMEEAIDEFLGGLEGQESCHLSKILHTCLYLYVKVCDLIYVFSIGWQSQFDWMCSSWRQPLKTQQTRVCVVSGHSELTTFGCVEWQYELFRGVMRAHCYPFNMPKKHFHGFNPKVCQLEYTSSITVYVCIY